MADENEFPPECEKSPTEFGFREFGDISIESGDGKRNENIRHSLLSVANIYGLAFVGCLDGVKVFSVDDLLEHTDKEASPGHIASISLRSAPHWVAVSSDNLTLAVCSTSDKGLQVLFFDTRNFINKSKSTKTPFAIHVISKSSQHVVDMHWNPSQENTHYLAICVSDGTFQILSVKENVQEIAKKPPEFGACAVCWSPRGKQMMIGRRDGSIQQYTPAMEIRRTVPVCETVEPQVRVCDVLWLSTLQVAVTYVMISEGNEGDAQPSLFVANLPPAKGQDKTVKWTSFDDPCYGIANPQAPHFQSTYVDKWGLFVLASSKASETAVLGKNKENIWEIWTLDDSCRAQLPMQDESEQFPLGSAVIYTAKKGIIIDDTRESGPMPVYAMLSNQGHLGLFHMINLQPEEDYPNLIIEAKQLAVDGERSAVPSNSGSLDTSVAKPLLTPSGKQKLVGKPSILMKTSTPKLNLGTPQESNSSQLSVTPVQGFHQPQKPIAEEPPRGVSPVAKSLTNTFTMLKTNPDFMRLPESPVPGTPDTDVASGMRQPPQLVTAPQPNKTNMPALKVEATKTLSHPTAGISSPFKAPLPKPQPPAEAEPQAPINRVSSLQSLNDIAPGSAEKLKRKSVIGKTRERVNSLQSVEADVLADSLRSEIVDFDQELATFLQECAPVDKDVTRFDEEFKKSSMKGSVEQLSEFRDGIKQTTFDQHEEIKTCRTHTLEMYSALKNVETRKLRMENRAYRDALHSRPLDLADQRKMKEIQSAYQYIKEAIRQTNAALDEQWHKFSQSQKSSSLRKSKRKMQLEETDMIMKVVLNQMQILHDKERAIMQLGQQMDRLKVLRSTVMHSPLPRSYKQTKLHESFAAQDSADLSALADTLIHQQSPQLQASRKESPTTKISPKKTSQLSQMLGNRKTTPVRATTGPRSSFVMPPFRRRSDARASESESQSQRSDYSRSSSFTTDQSEPYTTDGGSVASYENSDSAKENLAGSIPAQNVGSQREMPPFNVNRGSPAPKPMQGLGHRPLSKMNTVMSEGFAPPNQAAMKPPMGETPKSFIKPGETSTPQVTSVLGHSTITYGGPKHEAPHAKPLSFDAGTNEAASNLNNPPQVINIKNMKEQENPNLIPFSSKFEPKPDVPPAAAAEVQKVLNAVVAERQRPSTVMSMIQQANTAPPADEQRSPTPSKAALAKSTAQESSLASILSSGKPASSTGESTKPTSTGVFGNLANSSNLPNFAVGLSSNIPGLPKLSQAPLSAATTSKVVTPSTSAQATKPSSIFTPSEKVNFGGFSLQNRGSASSPAVFDLLKVAAKKPEEAKPEAPKTPAEEEKGPEAPTATVAPAPNRATPVPQPPDPPATTPPAKPAPALPTTNEPPAAPKAPTPAPEEAAIVGAQQTPKEATPRVAVAPMLGSAPGQPAGPDTPGVEVQEDDLDVDAPGAAFAPKTAAPVSAGFGFGAVPQSSVAGGFAATKSDAAPVFGQPAASGLFSGLAKSTQQTTSTTAPVFGSGATTSSGFGAAPSFGSIAAGAPSSVGGGGGLGFGSGGGGGGFLSGLGSSAPATDKPPSNPFAAASTAPAAPAVSSSSLFGSTGASSPFGKTPQSQPQQQSAFGASSASPGFNAFSKPTTGGFGSPPSFGSAAFGSKPVFGSTSQFGSATGFGSPAAFSSPPGMSAPSTSAGHVFGSMSGGFGSFGNQNQSSGFGALASQSSGGFGELAQQGQTGFGSQPSGFGSGGTGSGGFGSAATGSGGFGSAGTGSGGFGSAGTGSGGFGSAGTGTGGFGSSAQSGGFGSVASQGGFGSSSGGFGSFGSGGTGGGSFGASQPQQNKPSFSGWR